jgi:SAM-dependent methyltransferase
MSLLDEALQWNRRKWEMKNQAMYSSGSANRWPWYNEQLDADVADLLRANPWQIDSVLDLGTCSGSQAIGLAALGFSVIGSDVSETALEQARAKHAQLRDPGLKLEFIVDDIINSRFPDGRFDMILDRGCYHSICCFSHDSYVSQVKRILKPGGHLLLKTMSAAESRFENYEDMGGYKVQMPYHFDEAKLRELFAKQFNILDIRDSFFHSETLQPPARAKLAILANKQ